MAAPLRASRQRRTIDEVPFWYHSIDLGGGLVTPGFKSPESMQAHLAAFQSAIVQTTLAGNVDNPVRGFVQGGWSYRVFYVSRMTAANKVYFFLGGDPAGAGLIRMGQGGVETQLQGAGSYEEFTNNRHVFGVKAVRGVGFGMWQKSALVTLS